MQDEIPFNRPALLGRELDYMQDAVLRGHASGDGSYTQKCHQFLEERTGCAKVLLTTSCTHALEMSALLLDLKPGDEVILPSFTFVSTANAFALRGAKLVFADIRMDTMNLDEKAVEPLITERTKAVVAVHYAGVACEMDCLGLLAGKKGVCLVEDNAHGLFGDYKGRPLGGLGGLATLSFHETKNFTCGEGGALLINDHSMIERAEILREKGTNRKKFFRGEVDKYTWVDLGSSYLPSDILAAFLYAQLEYADQVMERRRRLWNRYSEELGSWALGQSIGMPHVPGHCRQAFHMFYLLMPDGESRERFLGHMRQRGIHAVFHYQPLHLSSMGRRTGWSPDGCPNACQVADRIVRLPFFTSMTADEQDRVIAAAKSFAV